MLRYNREKSFKKLGGKTPSTVTINYFYLKRRDMSWCKCHILSSHTSDTGPQWIERENTHTYGRQSLYCIQDNAFIYSSCSCGENSGLLRQAIYLVHKFSPIWRNIYSCNYSWYTSCVNQLLLFPVLRKGTGL